MVSIFWRNCIGKAVLQLIEKQTIWSTGSSAKNMSVEHVWDSLMSCTEKGEIRGQKKGGVKEY